MILAVVLSYFPNNELLRRNIDSFIEHVDKVLIWENTPKSEKLNYRFIHHEKIEYCGDGINSISHALNYSWRYAKENGYNYLLTMDQDSVWEDFADYLSKTVYSKDAPVGIWGPNAYDRDYDTIVEHDTVITSGMLVGVDLIDIIGGWNEVFNVDCVDDEFCLHAKRKGIKSYIYGHCKLVQRYGNPRVVTFLGKTSRLRNDSPKRLYSIYRSFPILIKMYPEEKAIKAEFYKEWIGLIKWILVFEDNKFRKFFAIVRGLFSGYTCSI